MAEIGWREYPTIDSGGLAVEADNPMINLSNIYDGDPSTSGGRNFVGGNGGFSIGSWVSNFVEGLPGTGWSTTDGTAWMYLDYEIVDISGPNPTWDMHIHARFNTAAPPTGQVLIDQQNQTGPVARYVLRKLLVVPLSSPTSLTVFFWFKPDAGAISGTMGMHIYDCYVVPPGAATPIGMM